MTRAAIILAVAGVAIGFAAGFFVGRGEKGTVAPERSGEMTLIGRAPRAPASETPGPMAGENAAVVMASAPAGDADFNDKDDFVKELAASDPMKAVAWAQANSDEGSRDDLFQTIATVWAKQDPEAAFAWANGLPLKQEREDSIRGVMEGALEAGHEEVALSFIDRLPPGEYQDSAMVVAVKHLAATSLDRAIELAGRMGENFSMRYAGRAIAEVLIESGRIDEAKQRVTELPYGMLRTQLALGIVERLGDKDTAAVMAWIEQRPTGPDGGEIFDTSAMSSLAYSLSRDLVAQGPAEALAWADNLEDKNLRNRYLERIGETWASRSPQEASEWLINALNEQGFENLRQVSEGIFDEWTEVDQNAPFEQIKRIADPETRSKAAFMALNEIARENPRIAAERLADWTEVDPVAAGQVAARVVSSWLRRDPEQASIWLNEQPRGVIKDRGVEQLVHSLLSVDKDTESARAWVGEVQDGKLRDKLIQQVESVEGGKRGQGKANSDPFR